MDFLNGRKTIVAAVAFDENAPVLARLGAWLSQRLGNDLHLIHTIDSHGFADASALSRDTGLDTELRIRQLFLQRSCEEKLEQMKEANIPQVTAETAAVFGEQVNVTVESEAVKRLASVIVTGINERAARLFPYGMSTAVSLAANSTVPVMIASKRTDLEFLNRSYGPGILIADDFAIGSEEFVSDALKLAIGLKCSVVKHVHVYSQETGNSDVSETVRQQVLNSLATRAQVFAEELSKIGCAYESEAINAKNTVDALSRSADESGVDLIVFGRHKTLHFKPFRIGRVPLRSLLVQKQVIVIVPSAIDTARQK